jgi:hypothetical protein
MAFVRGRTSFEERFVEAVVPLHAPSLTAGSISGRVAWAELAPTADAPDTDCASVLSLADGAAGAAPCAASVGSAGGSKGVGVHSPSAVRAVRDCPDLLAPLNGRHALHDLATRSAAGMPYVHVLFSGDTELHNTYLRPTPRASAGTSRGVPASSSRDAGYSHATQTTPAAREADGKEENN